MSGLPSVDIEQPALHAPVFFRPFAAWQIQSRPLFPTFPASVWHRDAYTGFTYRVIDASNPPRSGLFLPQGITSRRASFTGRHFRGHP